jgi:hypothetical protein
VKKQGNFYTFFILPSEFSNEKMRQENLIALSVARSFGEKLKKICRKRIKWIFSPLEPIFFSIEINLITSFFVVEDLFALGRVLLNVGGKIPFQSTSIIQYLRLFAYKKISHFASNFFLLAFVCYIFIFFLFA